MKELMDATRRFFFLAEWGQRLGGKFLILFSQRHCLFTLRAECDSIESLSLCLNCLFSPQSLIKTAAQLIRELL